MRIEALRTVITYRWPGGEVRLVPGRPVDLPQDRAERLLAKAPGKVRIIEDSRPAVRRFWPNQYVNVESAGGPSRRGIIEGEPSEETMRDGTTARWYIVGLQDGWMYVHECRLSDTTAAR